MGGFTKEKGHFGETGIYRIGKPVGTPFIRIFVTNQLTSHLSNAERSKKKGENPHSLERFSSSANCPVGGGGAIRIGFGGRQKGKVSKNQKGE